MKSITYSIVLTAIVFLVGTTSGLAIIREDAPSLNVSIGGSINPIGTTLSSLNISVGGEINPIGARNSLRDLSNSNSAGGAPLNISIGGSINPVGSTPAPLNISIGGEINPVGTPVGDAHGA
ncbi:hypothetical protein QBC45DRAFT_455814 [Copromyces sp. CBS 386.78]|nr:hypothetical protein QBC45DRAFT_455814 [Copromyces sp. CBS 386.78]